MEYTYKGIWEALRSKLATEVYDTRAKLRRPTEHEAYAFEGTKETLKYMDELENLIISDYYTEPSSIGTNIINARCIF